MLSRRHFLALVGLFVAGVVPRSASKARDGPEEWRTIYGNFTEYVERG